MKITYGVDSLENSFLALLLAIAILAAGALLAVTVGARRKIGFVRRGKMFRERSLFLGVLRVAREILPFVRIGRFVVQFFVPVGVANVAPPFAADGVVAFLMRR